MVFSTHILPRRTSTGLRNLTIIAYVVPLVYVLATSFKSTAEINRNPAGPVFMPTLDNYSSSISSDLFRAAGVSIAIALSVTVIVLVIGVPAAYSISRLRGPSYSVAMALLILLQLVPAAATLMPQYQFLYQLGLLGTVQGLILVDAAGVLPFAILLLVPFCAKIPDEVLDASEVDGVGIVRRLWSIVLSLTLIGVLVVEVITFIGAWGEFLAAVTFINDPSLQPLSLVILSSIGANTINFGTLTAVAVLASLPLLVLYLLVQRRMRDGLNAGAVR